MITLEHCKESIPLDSSQYGPKLYWKVTHPYNLKDKYLPNECILHQVEELRPVLD